MTHNLPPKCLALGQTTLRSLLAAQLLAGFQTTSLGDVVTDWNSAALGAVRALRVNPPVASRAFAITHLAIHDAAQGVQSTHRPYLVNTKAPVGASLEAAIASAGYTSLSALFTNPDVQTTNFQALYTAHLNAIPEGQSKTDGVAWGRSVAETILAARANDGSTSAVAYTPSGLAGRWKPAPGSTVPALLPGWGWVRTFALVSGSQFRPPPPPVIGGAAYSLELNTVKMYGGVTSTARTRNQTQVARFWNDGAGTATPPGHWNVIAQNVSREKSLSAIENARLFALLNIVMADAAIACWDAKFTYDLWRPVTAIREADIDDNPETEPDPEWESLIPTPPFPEYTSGHSTFSRGAATVLANFFGTDAIPFSTTSDGLPNVIRSYPGFSAAADEAGASRLYGGIHWPSANIHGQACGLMIAQHAANYLLQPLNSPQFAQVHRMGDRTQLEFLGEPGRTYVIRASSDLKTWETIATVSSVDGVIQFDDVNAGGLQTRFYDAAAQ